MPKRLRSRLTSVLLTFTLVECWTTQFHKRGSISSENSRKLSPSSYFRCSPLSLTSTMVLNPNPEEATRDAIPIFGSVVTIDCRLKPEGSFIPEPLFDGILLHDDAPSTTLSFVLGNGNYIPGLHELVSNMQVGDTVENVSLDAGWGSYDPGLVATFGFDDMGVADRSLIQPGVKISLSNGLKCTVTDVTDESFTADANAPLAGTSYAATVKLLSVEEGPILSEYSEDEEAAAHFKQRTSRFEVATFALGCFWGGELEYMREPGVVGTAVGYTQGQNNAGNPPSYKEVCSGTTGHAEAIAVAYDPDKVSYKRLVELAMNRLGANKYLRNQVNGDKGTQYRHGVYYHTPSQKEVAEKLVGSYGEDCVTECLPAKKFWIAEDYHQQYLLKGGQSARKNDTSDIRCYG